MRREQAIKLIRNEHATLKDQFFVKSLLLFGGVARDEARPGSDIDFIVEFTQPVGFFHFIALKQYLEEILSCDVDLGTYRSLKPFIKKRVLDEAVLVA